MVVIAAPCGGGGRPPQLGCAKVPGPDAKSLLAFGRADHHECYVDEEPRRAHQHLRDVLDSDGASLAGAQLPASSSAHASFERQRCGQRRLDQSPQLQLPPDANLQEGQRIGAPLVHHPPARLHPRRSESGRQNLTGSLPTSSRPLPRHEGGGGQARRQMVGVRRMIKSGYVLWVGADDRRSKGRL